jgi:hypothetical protein
MPPWTPGSWAARWPACSPTGSTSHSQAEVRRLLADHLIGLAETSGDDVLLPAEIRIVVAEKRGPVSGGS